MSKRTGTVSRPPSMSTPTSAPVRCAATQRGGTPPSPGRATESAIPSPAEPAGAGLTGYSFSGIRVTAAEDASAPRLWSAAPAPVGDVPERAAMESFFGRSFADVDVTTGADAALAPLAADAVTVGNSIAFAGSSPPRDLVAHELVHVAQNLNAGRAGTLAMAAGVVSSESSSAEAEAELIAARVAAHGLTGPAPRITARPEATIHRVPKRGRRSAIAPNEDELLASPNAWMTVRAYDGPGGALLDMWVGPAYFVGEFPAPRYVGRRAGRQGTRWAWNADGRATTRATALKIDSDREGKAGTPVETWAPRAAQYVTVDYRPLHQPFALGPVAVDGAPLPRRTSEFRFEPAVGTESLDASAPVGIQGPLRPGTRLESGDLVIDQESAELARLSLEGTVLEIVGGKSETYAFTVEPQTSPRQRVVTIVATRGVTVSSRRSAEAASATQELVHHVHQLSDPSLIVGPGDARTTAAVALPLIAVAGDDRRVILTLDHSKIHIEAIGDTARFAYFVDPDWSGRETLDRVVHIVATPGVRVDSWNSRRGVVLSDHKGTQRVHYPYGIKDHERASGQIDRTLVANTMYVQDPALVPTQGTPIDPSQYLGVERRHFGKAGDDRRAIVVFTGAAGVTIRDGLYGATLTLRAFDPTIGARFAYEIVPPANGATNRVGEVRALVGPGVGIEIVAARRPLPGDTTLPDADFGNLDVVLYETDDESKVPAQGTPLPRDFLASIGTPRSAPVPVYPPKTTVQMAAEIGADVGLGFLPGSEVVDLMEVAHGTDRWGNELSAGERIIVGIAILLPFVSAGSLRAATKSATRVAGTTGEIATLAVRMGRTAEEMEAFLAQLRRLSPDAQASVRRIHAALELGADFDAADFERVRKAIAGFGMGHIPADSRRIIVAPTSAGSSFGNVVRRGPRSPVLTEKQAELTTAVRKYLRGHKVRPAPFRIEIVEAREFGRSFASRAKGRAAFTVGDGDSAVIYARADATPHDMVDEAAHLAQLRDPAVAPDVRILSEANVATWHRLVASDRLELMQRKLRIEVDAKERTLRALEGQRQSGGGLATEARANLEQLHGLKERLEQITPDELGLMNAGALPMPPELVDPAWLFGKRSETLGTTYDAHRMTAEDLERSLGPALPRERHLDWSSAYNQKDVASVRVVGEPWREQLLITSGYDGVVKSIGEAEGGGLAIVVKTKGGGEHTYVTQAGAALGDGVAVGAKVRDGTTLAREVSREYRQVQVTRRQPDGSTATEFRGEIRSAKPDRGWIQRGSESTLRGAITEDASRLQIDAELAAKVDKGKRGVAGGISGFARLPHQRGGGGFDDVVVEFQGTGDDVTAFVRIIEVKDYPNRSVRLEEFTAIRGEGIVENLTELRRSTVDALARLDKGEPLPNGFPPLVEAQLDAVVVAIENRQFRIELVTGPSTQLGAESHHAARVITELRAELKQLLEFDALAGDAGTYVPRRVSGYYVEAATLQRLGKGL